MPSHFFQHHAEVLELFGRCPSSRSFQILKEGPHPVETGFVERLQDAERGKQECPRAARRVQHGDAGNRLIEGAEKFGAFRRKDRIFHKSPDVEIQRYQVVDFRDAPLGKALANIEAALAAGGILAPGFSRKGIFRLGGAVPAAALGHILDPLLDLGGNRNDLSFLVR